MSLNCIVVGNIYLIQVDGIVDIGPHVMVLFYVPLKFLLRKYRSGYECYS